jgi:hypothetical protein
VREQETSAGFEAMDMGQTMQDERRRPICQVEMELDLPASAR